MAKIIRHSKNVTADEKKSDDLIVCKVCLACYDEGHHLPFMLQCRHTFCAMCIADSLMTPDDRSKIVCPLCKSRTCIGKKGIVELPVNEISLELVRDLAARRKQQEVIKAGSDLNRPPFSDGLTQQNAYPVGSAKTSTQQGQTKGILKVKPKQTRLQRQEVFVIEETKAAESASFQSAVEKGGGGRIAEEHTVIVKSVHRLHPPPQSIQPLQMETTDEEMTQGSPAGNGLDSSEVDVEFPVEETQSVSNEDATLTYRSPDFLQPQTESSDPNFVIPNTTPDPFRIDNTDNTDNTDDKGSSRRIYPVNALLYMASADGVPLDQIGSAGPEMASDLLLPSASLTDSQRLLSSSAKYVGRFGKYSEKRQPGSFQFPKKISCSSDGTRIAISDPQGHAVHVYSSKGEFVCFFDAPNVTGGICFLSDDHLAVATANGVQVHLVNGTQKKTLPIVGVLAVAPFQQGFVAASRNRVSVCKSLVGSVIHSINGKRDPEMNKKLIPFEEIVDVAVSSKPNLCILEAKFVLITDEEGTIITVIRPAEDGPCGSIGRGIALAACPEDQSIVVVDEGHRRILLFGPDGQFANCLVNLDHPGAAASGDVSGVVVTKSRKLFAVSTGSNMAEVRVYTF